MRTPTKIMPIDENSIYVYGHDILFCLIEIRLICKYIAAHFPYMWDILDRVNTFPSVTRVTESVSGSLPTAKTAPGVSLMI